MGRGRIDAFLTLDDLIRQAPCHRCLWTVLAEGPPIDREDLASWLRRFDSLAEGARVPESVLPLVVRVHERNARLRPVIDEFLATHDLPIPPSRPAAAEIDETIEVATDGVIGIGSFASIRLFEDSRNPRAARKHRVLAFDTGDDGVYAIRVRTGFAWRAAAPVRVIDDAIHLFGVGFLSHEISLESGDYAASVVRSTASEDAAVITLERVSEPVRWPFGDSFPAPFAVTGYERALAYR